MKKIRSFIIFLCAALLLSGCTIEGISTTEPVPTAVSAAAQTQAPEALPEESPGAPAGETPGVTPEETPEASAEPTPAAASAEVSAPQPEEEAAAGISIWYTLENPLAEAVGVMSEAYNASSPPASVTVRAFDTESELAEALELSRPDMLLVTGSTADGLYSRGSLCAVDADISYLPGVTDSEDYIGSCFFPLAFSTTALAVNESALEGCEAAAGCPGNLSTLEDLCACARSYTEETGKPFFAAESFAELFSAYMHFSGTDFTGERAADVQSGIYAEVYNLLALEAQAGSLYIGSDAVSEFAAGNVPVLFACTDTLAGIPGDYTLLSLPDCGTVSPGCMGYSVGIAVTAEDPGSSAYISWYLEFLCGYDFSASANAAGLISCIAGNEAAADIFLCSYEEHSARFSGFDDHFISMMELLK